MVGFYLDGTVANQFKAWESDKLPSEPPAIWKTFQVAFLQQFLLEGERYAKMQKFISLKQERMIMSKYATYFLYLSQFTRHLIPSKRD